MANINWFLLFVLGFLLVVSGFSAFLGADTAHLYWIMYHEGKTPSYYKDQAESASTAGWALTVIGFIFAVCTCPIITSKLSKSPQMNTITTRLETENENTQRNLGRESVLENQAHEIIELNPLGQEARNLGVETTTNHEVIEFSPLGQEAGNLGAETINLEQDQNQINQQHEAKIEIALSNV